jgi:hypothetical protein
MLNGRGRSIAIEPDACMKVYNIVSIKKIYSSVYLDSCTTSPLQQLMESLEKTSKKYFAL